MEDGAPNLEGRSAVGVGSSSFLAQESLLLERCDSKCEAGSPMIEECSIKSEDICKIERSCAKTDVSFAMDVASPSSKMEVGSPNMEVNSPSMEVSSPKMEEGSAKMEEVALKMGEVSVKSEDVSLKSKENVSCEQGSSKMEEVAVKMGEVSVKSENNHDKASEETVKKMVKRRVIVFHGAKCLADGEVPDWLTIDILLKAICNDRPGTKKPQIRPFGSNTKPRTDADGQQLGKSHPFSQENAFDGSVSSHVVRPSGNNLVSEPSSSQPLARPTSNQSAAKASPSQPGNKPSTSQPAKQSSSQSASMPSSSSAPDRLPSVPLAKGKVSGGRIKGKSSVSLYKGKAPASEAALRASMQFEAKSMCVSGESGNSTEALEGRLGEKSEGKASEDDTTCSNLENNILLENQGDDSALCASSDSSMDSSISRNNQEAVTSCNSMVNNDSGGIVGEILSPDDSGKLESCDYSSNSELSEMFKKPTDPPKRTLKKPTIPPKRASGTFKMPGDPPKRALKANPDPPKETTQISETPIVDCRQPDLSSEHVKEVTDDSKMGADEPPKSTFETPIASQQTEESPPKRLKLPPLRVIRFISQRLSVGNTVYRVRATAVRGRAARDFYFVVKLCTNSTEVMYYRKVAPRIPYVPRVLLCDRNIVVMDDLIHEGFCPTKGNFTPAEMMVAIDGLARMHTASVIALKSDPSLLEAFPQASNATESDITRDLRLLADRVKTWSLPDAEFYAGKCKTLADCVPYLLERLEPADTNMTVLLHGNVSPRNVFFLYDSRNPRLPAMASFVDFANVYWGHPALDISLVTGPAGGFWEGYKIVLMSLLTRASGRMWLPQPEVKDCGETYAFALLRAVCGSVSGPAAKVLEARLDELFPVFRQYSWLDFW